MIIPLLGKGFFMAIATKKLLADGLKELLKKKTLDKITVKELVAICGVNRQTFYYNFQDIYELLEWIFVEEGERLKKETEEMTDWRERLQVVINELNNEETRRLILNAFYSVNPMQIDKFMQNYFRPSVEEIITENIRDVDISEENREFMIRMYDLFFVDLVMRWIQSGMEMSEMTGDIEKIISVMTGSSVYIAQGLKDLETKKRESFRPAGENNRSRQN